MKPIRLFTSRYGAQEEILASGAVPVRISLGKPRFKLRYPLIEKVSDLMPSRAMLSMPYERYLSIYRDRLERVGVAPLRSAFQEIANANEKDRLVLLCFEDLRKPGQWCHRTLFASWWTAQTGEPVTELETLGVLFPDAL